VAGGVCSRWIARTVTVTMQTRYHRAVGVGRTGRGLADRCRLLRAVHAKSTTRDASASRVGSSRWFRPSVASLASFS
jgi:hypothetical protein